MLSSPEAQHLEQATRVPLQVSVEVFFWKGRAHMNRERKVTDINVIQVVLSLEH